MRGLALGLLVALPLGASAAPWETTGKGVIDPLNGALHRHLPTDLRTRDLTALLGLYTTESGGGVGWAGARVRVLANGRWQTRVVGAGSGFVSAHSLVQHVGLGPASTVERIEIDWPAGHRTVHGPFPGDRRREIREETH